MHNDTMSSQANHLRLGAASEEVAARFVRSLGWRILERNWRPSGLERNLELDMVAKNENGIIFIEVKARRVRENANSPGFSGQDGYRSALTVPAYAAFTPQKQNRIARAAACYLSRHDLWNMPSRFDLICIEQGPDGHERLEHYSNVIELGNFVDSGHSSWQPW